MKNSRLNLILIPVGLLAIVGGFIHLLNSGTFSPISSSANTSEDSGLIPFTLLLIFLGIISTALGVGLTIKKQLSRHQPTEATPRTPTAADKD